METVVIKPGLRVDQAKGLGPGLHGLTQVNLEKLKKKYFRIFQEQTFFRTRTPYGWNS
jgi:hypothetical protein